MKIITFMLSCSIFTSIGAGVQSSDLLIGIER